MLGRFRPRLTYANVISTVCLFVLLGGGAWAASSFVDSKGKIHGCVDRKGVLTLVKAGKKCGKHRSQITWSQRGPQGRTGLQGRTGTVNTSNFFTKAQSDGRFMRGAGNAAKIDYRCDTSIANTCEDTPLPVLSIDDLTLNASCNGSVGISVSASTSVDGARLGVFLNHPNPGPENYVTSPFDKTSPVNVTETYTDSGNGTLVYSRPGGPAISVALEYGAPPHTNGIICDLHGTAIAVL